VCIGTDHVQIAVGAIDEPAELAALVDRIEQLLEAGYATVEITSAGAATSVASRGPAVVTKQSGCVIR
jgi:hypothetical protein